MQRNAVIMSRARRKTSAPSEDENINEDEEQASLAETMKKNDAEQRKFLSFWSGVKQGLDAFDKKYKYEKRQLVKNKGAKKIDVINENVFNPNSGWRISWDLLLAVLVIYSIVIIPYEIGMAVDSSVITNIVDWIITALFALDILINFNTAYIDPSTEKMEYNRQAIIRNYSKFWLWIDILATIPFDAIIGVFVAAHNFKSIRVIRILRLVRLIKIYRIFSEDERIEKYFFNPALLSLIVLMLQIFYVAHIFACFFHYLTLPGAAGDFNESWITKFNFQDKPVNEKYVASLYFIVITMTTVGYGDIYGTNQAERLFAILTMLTGGVVFGALVGRVTSLIDKRNPQAKAFKEKMDEFKCFLSECLIPHKVAQRSKTAYYYYLSKRSAFGEAGIFDELPRAILKELVYELYHDDISSINMFASIESAFVIEIITNSRPFQTHADESIFEEGDVCNEIIFVKEGCIRIIASTGNKHAVIGCVTEGDYFGDAEFLRNTTAVATYQSINTAHMLSVPHTVMTRAINASSNQTALQLNRWFELRYANLSTLLRSKGNRPPPRPKLMKRAATMVFGGARRRSNSHHAHNGMSFFGSFNILSSTHDEDDYSDSDDDNPLARSPPKYRLSSISRNLWINGEIKDASSSMAFLRVNKGTSGSRGHKVRIVQLTAEGEEEIVEKPATYLAEQRLFNPMGLWKIRWDFFVGLLILYSVLVVPVEIAYNGNAFAESDTFNLVINGFFFVDIVFSFITAVPSEVLDGLIVDKGYISRTYLQGWFAIDLISTVPFDAIVQASTSSNKNLSFTKLIKVIRLLRLLKLARILKLSSYIEKIEDSLGISPIIFALVSLLIQVFFIAHWTSCLWYGLTSIISNEPWFDNYGETHGQGLDFFPLKLAGTTLQAQYLMSLYYTLTTMTTVGYGDIHPTNMPERALGILLALCGASLFGYMIANVSGLLSSIGGANSSAKEHLSEVSEYLKEKNCPSALQEKIKNHYKRQVKEKSAYDVDRIVSRLPSMISNDVLFYLNERRMSKIAFFPFLTNKSVAVYLLQKMTPVFCDEGHYIFREGEYSKEISFFVTGEAHAFQRVVRFKSKANFMAPTHLTEGELEIRRMLREMEERGEGFDDETQWEDVQDSSDDDDDDDDGDGYGDGSDGEESEAEDEDVDERRKKMMEKEDEKEALGEELGDDAEKRSLRASKHKKANKRQKKNNRSDNLIDSPNDDDNANNDNKKKRNPLTLLSSSSASRASPLNRESAGSQLFVLASSRDYEHTNVDDAYDVSLEMTDTKRGSNANADEDAAPSFDDIYGHRPSSESFSASASYAAQTATAGNRASARLNAAIEANGLVAVSSPPSMQFPGVSSTAGAIINRTDRAASFQRRISLDSLVSEDKKSEEDYERRQQSYLGRLLRQSSSTFGAVASLASPLSLSGNNKKKSGITTSMYNIDYTAASTVEGTGRGEDEEVVEGGEGRGVETPTIPKKKRGVSFFHKMHIDTAPGMYNNMDNSLDNSLHSGVSSNDNLKNLNSLTSNNNDPNSGLNGGLQPPRRRRTISAGSDPGSVASQEGSLSVNSTNRATFSSRSQKGAPKKRRASLAAQQYGNDLHTKFLPLKDTLSFIVTSRDQVAPDPVDELAQRKRKKLVNLSAQDYTSIDLQLLGKIEGGDFVGHSAYLKGDEKHHCSVRAVLPTTIYAFSKLEISRLIRQEPTVAIQFQAAMREAVTEQKMLKGKVHLQTDRANFLRSLRRKFVLAKRRSARRMSLMGSGTPRTPRTPNTPNGLRVSLWEENLHAKSPKDSNNQGRLKAAFGFWRSGGQSYNSHQTHQGSSVSGTGSVIGSVADTDLSGSHNPFNPNTGPDNLSLTQKILHGSLGPTRLQAVLRHENLYYDSDNSDEERDRMKRLRLNRTPQMKRAWHRLVKTLLRQRQPHRRLINFDTQGKLKRSASLSAIDYVSVWRDEASIAAFVQANASSNNGDGSNGNSNDNSNNNSNSNSVNNMGSAFSFSNLSNNAINSGRGSTGGSVQDDARSVHSGGSGGSGQGSGSHSSQRRRQQQRSLLEVPRQVRLMRRQSFPSVDNHEWKRDKLSDFVI